MVTSVQLKATLEGLGQRLVSQEQEKLRQVAQSVGSPCHILFPAEFAARINAFRQAFVTAGVNGEVFYATKANKSEAFLDTAAACGIGVDVASREEMISALGAGVAGERLMVTGPHKGASFHRLAIRHGACIAVDSAEELAALIETCRGDGNPRAARVVLRLRPALEARSRFGMDEQEIREAIALLAQERSHLCLEGFSIHLGGYDVAARAVCGAKLVELALFARELDHTPRLIDLGGGWPVCYVEEDQWKRLQEILSPEHFHASRKFDSFYPYFQPVAGADALRACLETPLSKSGNLALLCARHGLTLAVEPGRALLDQAGLSVFGIRAIKGRNDGYSIITAEGQSFSLSEQWFGSEFLPDPVLIPQEPRMAEPTLACVAGSSCLDSDMLTWRKIEFAVPPAPGDLLIYVNTAGYQMDSNESSFHRTPLPRKIAAWVDNGRLEWCDDALFHNVDPALINHSFERRNSDDYHAHHGLDRLHASA
jgi:diaminopimelate decarboxylase